MGRAKIYTAVTDAYCLFCFYALDRMGGLRVHHSRGSETWGTSWFKVNVLRRPVQGCAADLSLGNGLGADVH